MTKEIYKKMRNRVNTILRGKLGDNFKFVKMKFPDDIAADGVHVADSKLWKHALQIRRALLLLTLKTEREREREREIAAMMYKICSLISPTICICIYIFTGKV